ncbi:hypothetical protein [Specibacter sp. RAF43]|uniref:hypothetical protein n=1 Tax=Specibacter sp. RAF43 TaxID=3233057 RepID=UPI003F98C3F1
MKSSSRRRVELVVIPVMAALCMAFIIGAIVLDRDAGSCPPASWHNHVSVTLAGNHDAVAAAAAVTACTGSACIPLSPTFARNSAGGTGLLAHQPDGSWVLSVGSKPPAHVTFSVFDASGTVLARASNALNWTRVAGTEKCGGPMAEVRVLLQLP